jgi:hypothetical protein
MSVWIDEVAAWLIDFGLLATILLATTVMTGLTVRQPVQRILLAWTTLVGLLILAVLCAAPFWPRLVRFTPQSGSRMAAEQPERHVTPDVIPPSQTSNVHMESASTPAAVSPITIATRVAKATQS